MSRIREAWRGIVWYLREVSGENRYGDYLARHATTHPGQPALSRRAFERRMQDAADVGSRCC